MLLSNSQGLLFTASILPELSVQSKKVLNQVLKDNYKIVFNFMSNVCSLLYRSDLHFRSLPMQISHIKPPLSGRSPTPKHP